jgi:hypothetical protein
MAYFYNPSDARVECFGLELAIKNQDLHMLNFLWNDHQGIWEERHFSYIFDKILEEDWEQGLAKIFRSPTSHIIFKSLNAEDKDNFLNQKILDKVTSQEYWERNETPVKVNANQVEKVMAYLQEKPYGGYTAMRYPSLLEQFDMLESTLGMVKNEDIHDYVIARQENMAHFNAFIKGYKGSAMNKLLEI